MYFTLKLFPHKLKEEEKRVSKSPMLINVDKDELKRNPKAGLDRPDATSIA